MDSIKSLFEFMLHLDHHLNILIQYFGPTVYFIFFLIIFCETGLVIFPFLPGDSLLFALGAFAAAGVGGLKLQSLLLILWLATMVGDSTNYWIGYFTGVEILSKQKLRFIHKEYLDRAYRFYEKHGGKTVTIARFLPIIRTFAPFVAGISRMNYSRFLIFSICGSLGWVSIFMLGGYFFGNLPLIKQHFTLVIAAIILISLIPVVLEFIHQRRPDLKKNSNYSGL